VAERVSARIAAALDSHRGEVVPFDGIVTKLKMTDRLLNRFRISAVMHPYVLRVRLRGWHFDFGSNAETAVEFNVCINQMRKILVQRRIPVVAADKAISETLEAAVDHQLSQLRFDRLRAMEDQSHTTLQRLIEVLRRIGDAISQLPPTSKGVLNERVSGVFEQQIFDTEVFIDVMETIVATLPELSPRRLANDVLSLIYPAPDEGRRLPIIDLWETMPATTRVKIEELVQKLKLTTSVVGWLNCIADLLARERPQRKRGAPRSTLQLFVRRVAAIWRRLGLTPGLAYSFNLHPGGHDRIGRGGRIDSAFQRYCRSALATFGDTTKISARQVGNAKQMYGANPPGTPNAR
jgi:hypothetical protein